jgi:hypothetical protein
MPFSLPNEFGYPFFIDLRIGSFQRPTEMAQAVAPQTCSNDVFCSIRPIILPCDQMLGCALQIFHQSRWKSMTKCKQLLVFLPHRKLTVVAKATLLSKGLLAQMFDFFGVHGNSLGIQANPRRCVTHTPGAVGYPYRLCEG